MLSPFGNSQSSFGGGFDTVVLLLTDSTLTASNTAVGDIIEAGGFRYSVVSAGGDIQNSATPPVQFDVVSNDVVDVMAFGAIGDGVADDAGPINAALAKSGYVVLSGGVYLVNSALLIPSNTTFEFLNGASIRCGASVSNLLSTLVDADNIAIINPNIDSNNLVTGNTIFSEGVRGFSVIGGNLTNWRYAIVVNSSVARAAKRINISSNYLHTPGTPAIYPIQINNKTARDFIDGVAVNDNVIEGVAGAYSSTNNKTADQITMQGCVNFECTGNISKDGGEIGISISRLSSDGVVANNYCYGCDADGIQVGGGLVNLELSTPVTWALNDTITGATSGATGTLVDINGNFALLQSPTSGTFVEGENATNGTDVLVISKAVRGSNIIVSGNVCKNNGIDVDAAGGVFSGIKALQADEITVSDNICCDDRPVKKQDFGLYVSQVSRLVDSSNNFDRNLTADRSLNGIYSFYPTESVGALVTKKGAPLVISAGVLTVNSSFHIVDTESGAAADDINSISAGVDGQRLTLRAVTSSRVVTINQGAGIKLSGASVVLDSPFDTISFIYDELIGAWLATGFSNNG